MPTLHLGVIDVPYAGPASAPTKTPKAKRGKANKPLKPKVAAGTQTTGDVAEWLENKYGIMQTFVDKHREEVFQLVVESIADSLMDSTFRESDAGAVDPFGNAMSAIDARFKAFLNNQEMDGMPGVPTEAALKGVDHRLKHPYAKRGPRKSFIDTGGYQRNFAAWVEK